MTITELKAPFLEDTASPGELGRWGEELAVRYLETNGYTILDRNFRCREGELDIVARCGQRGLLAIEVKTRRARGKVPAELAVSQGKMMRLRRLFALWLQKHSIHEENISLDLVAITVMQGGAWYLHHIEDIS